MSEFHFLNPHWLWLVLPLLALLWWLKQQKNSNSAWQKVIEPQLLQHLLIQDQGKSRNWPYIIAAVTGLLTIVALANPVWEKRPQSVMQTPRALVLVLDLSASMNASDLKPSRMLRARLKVQDILQREQEGLTGLVVFAGDAFSVTPLTRDNETISSQLRVLEPSIMPAQGSRVDLGLAKAGELLEQSGVHAGDILLIADGYDSAQAILEARKLHNNGHRISILGVGTRTGAPVSNGQGDVFRDENDIPILAKLDEERFIQLAKQGGGLYSPITIDDADLQLLLGQSPLNFDQSMDTSLFEQNQWKQNGPYLTLLLLPLAALAFRRGWLLTILVAFVTLPIPQPAMALSMNELWNDLWQTREQRASDALNQQHHEEAARLSSDPAVVGSALYKQQKYPQALEQFEQLSGDADADYNRGNTLARMGQYEQAIDAYDKALQHQPDMQHAIDNKAAVEELLKQMQQQPGQQQNQQDDEEQSESKDSQDNESENKKQQQSAEQQEQEQQSDYSQQQKDSDNQDSQQQSGDDKQQNDSGSQQDKSQQQDDSQQQDTGQQPDNNNTPDNQPPSDNQFADANEAMQKDDRDSQPQQPDQAREQEAQAAQQRQQQAQQQTGQQTEQLQNTKPEDQQASELNTEEKLAAEQWLRRIPDDPGGLLKRKFLYQYQQRNRKPSSRQPW